MIIFILILSVIILILIFLVCIDHKDVEEVCTASKPKRKIPCGMCDYADATMRRSCPTHGESNPVLYENEP